MRLYLHKFGKQRWTELCSELASRNVEELVRNEVALLTLTIEVAILRMEASSSYGCVLPLFFKAHVQYLSRMLVRSREEIIGIYSSESPPRTVITLTRTQCAPLAT